MTATWKVCYIICLQNQHGKAPTSLKFAVTSHKILNQMSLSQQLQVCSDVLQYLSKFSKVEEARKRRCNKSLCNIYFHQINIKNTSLQVRTSFLFFIFTSVVTQYLAQFFTTIMWRNHTRAGIYWDPVSESFHGTNRELF